MSTRSAFSCATSKVIAGVLLDNKNNRPICRMHFNAASVKYLETFDEAKKGIKHKIESLSDIYKHEAALRATAGYYDKAE